jgi:hypothetical protein
MALEIANANDSVAHVHTDSVAPAHTDAVAAKLQADGNPPSGSKPATTDAPDANAAARVNDAFGQLSITDVGAANADKPLSPVMAEARRIEDGYRSRYAENDAAMKAVATVVGAGNPDINGHVTKDTIKAALTDAQSAAPGDAKNSSDFTAAAKYLNDNWNDLSLSPYKAMDGSITDKSAKDGKERMDGEQFAIAKQILATEMNALALDKVPTAAPAAKAPEAAPEATVTPKAAIIAQGLTRPGEGPYQVAARVLGSDGKPVDDQQLKELTDAFKKVYEEERKVNPQIHDLMGLKVGHPFISKENFAAVQSHITDSKLKARMTAIAGQDLVIKAPVIKPIPHRPTVVHQPHVVPLPPVRPASLGR